MSENKRSLNKALMPKPPKDKTTITPLEIIESGIYTEESLMVAIEEQLISGKSYRQICKDFNISLMGFSR